MYRVVPRQQLRRRQLLQPAQRSGMAQRRQQLHIVGRRVLVPVPARARDGDVLERDLLGIAAQLWRCRRPGRQHALHGAAARWPRGRSSRSPLRQYRGPPAGAMARCWRTEDCPPLHTSLHGADGRGDGGGGRCRGAGGGGLLAARSCLQHLDAEALSELWTAAAGCQGCRTHDLQAVCGQAGDMCELGKALLHGLLAGRHLGFGSWH
eukprot:361251-Chlamydomonas_euryale.AAC.3